MNASCVLSCSCSRCTAAMQATSSTGRAARTHQPSQRKYDAAIAVAPGLPPAQQCSCRSHVGCGALQDSTNSHLRHTQSTPGCSAIVTVSAAKGWTSAEQNSMQERLQQTTIDNRVCNEQTHGQNKFITFYLERSEAVQRRQLCQLNVAECGRAEPNSPQPCQLRDCPDGVHQYVISIAVGQPRKRRERRQPIYPQHLPAEQKDCQSMTAKQCSTTEHIHSSRYTQGLRDRSASARLLCWGPLRLHWQ